MAIPSRPEEIKNRLGAVVDYAIDDIQETLSNVTIKFIASPNKQSKDFLETLLKEISIAGAALETLIPLYPIVEEKYPEMTDILKHLEDVHAKIKFFIETRHKLNEEVYRFAKFLGEEAAKRN